MLGRLGRFFLLGSATWVKHPSADYTGDQCVYVARPLILSSSHSTFSESPRYCYSPTGVARIPGWSLGPRVFNKKHPLVLCGFLAFQLALLTIQKHLALFCIFFHLVF